ncbi:YeeE/YedE family protein [Ramlibacter sp.]|nr:YeeE/YedE family protein [Ramlibacter sp.]
MTTDELSRLTQAVLWGAFLLAALLGALVQRTGFCTMGAVSDAVLLGSWTRLRQWALATGTAMAGFAGLVALGWLRPDQTLYASTRWLWLSALSGGLLFGFGMVLSSGCVSKTLVRVGAGNLKALVVLLVAALSGFATLKGLTAVLRSLTVDRVGVGFGVNADLGSLAAAAGGFSPAAGGVALGLLGALALAAWALREPELRSGWGLGAGLGVGLLVLGMWVLTGHVGHLQEHPETLEQAWLATNSTRAEGFSFIAPSAFALDWLLFFSDAKKHLTVGIVSVAGVVAGSAAVALARRQFRWEGFASTGDLGHHLAGGLLMGVGGVTAMGCSIGQGVTGVSTLSLTSLTAAAAMVAGAVAGVRYQAWRLDRAA